MQSISSLMEQGGMLRSAVVRETPSDILLKIDAQLAQYEREAQELKAKARRAVRQRELVEIEIRAASGEEPKGFELSDGSRIYSIEAA